MNIAVEGDIYIGVSKDFAECLDIKTHLYTSCGECVTKRMIICILNSAFFYIRLKMILHSPRLDIFVLIATQDKRIGRISKSLRNLNDKSRERYIPHRALAFGFCDNNFCFCCCYDAGILDSLHGFSHLEPGVWQANVLPA